MNNQTKKPPMGGMGPSKGPMSVEKAKDFKGTTKKLLNNYLSNYKIAIIIVIIFAIGSTIFSIVGPKILGNATTEIYNGLISKISGGEGINFQKILEILLTLLGLYLISMLFSAIQGFTMTGVAQKLTYKMRNELIEKINKLPMKYFDKRTNGEVLSIISNDIDTLSQNLNQCITQIITSICTLIGILIMMLSISWQMTIASLIILPVAALLVKKIVSKSQKYFKNQQDYLGHVNGQVEEIYGGHTIVKAFNSEKTVISEFEKANQELYSSGWKSQFLSGLIHPVMNFISNVGYVAVAILGGYFAAQGKITVGNIQSFIQYNKQFTQPINQIAQVSGMLQAMVAASERVFEFLEEPEEIKNIENPKSTEYIKGNVQFEHVNFGYDADKVIINDFNANIQNGQKIAIVGPTGAGKTTIVKLLMRFYDVNSGAILLDGSNIKEFDRGELRRVFGMVLQDTWLFGGTVKENIKYGKEDATDTEVIEAAKAAHVHHFIKTLPKGYDALIDEESSNISAGQKQLLTIARVILTNPKILILDEATSSIDTRTEQQIQTAMDNLMKGRTSFIIAHRLSTIKNADLILVMEHGDIVEQGTHSELLEKNGAYARLYNSQFDLEE
ncbi:MAG: ABC transporter ATP-binding protein [Clostridia bacterium]|jgi:ATP-binding cassette subfamily B multidrug efflux pump|nr:aBC transporter ATP-binding protein [Clostridium sp. CAG:798]